MNNPVIILHSPQLGENIGAAARAMLNFGLTDLRLVSPRDGWPNPHAIPMSAGAFEAGVTVQSFDTLEEATQGITWLLAATARKRGMTKPETDASGAVARLAERAAAGKGRGAVMFGGEQSGLPNEAVAISDEIMTYRVNPEFASLNLAQAVIVFASAWGERADGVVEPAPDIEPPANRADLIRMFEHFEDELDKAGFFHPPSKTPLMKDTLRAAFIRADWTEQEVRTFRGAIKALALGRGKARVKRD